MDKSQPAISADLQLIPVAGASFQVRGLLTSPLDRAKRAAYSAATTLSQRLFHISVIATADIDTGIGGSHAEETQAGNR